MVLIKDLLTNFDTKFDINNISETLLRTRYDEELSVKEFQAPEHTVEEGRDKYTFESKEVTIIIYDNPLIVEMYVDIDGVTEVRVFDAEGNTIANS